MIMQCSFQELATLIWHFTLSDQTNYQNSVLLMNKIMERLENHS